jgi:hypothetical protein
MKNFNKYLLLLVAAGALTTMSISAMEMNSEETKKLENGMDELARAQYAAMNTEGQKLFLVDLAMIAAEKNLDKVVKEGSTIKVTLALKEFKRIFDKYDVKRSADKRKVLLGSLKGFSEIIANCEYSDDGAENTAKKTKYNSLIDGLINQITDADQSLTTALKRADTYQKPTE